MPLGLHLSDANSCSIQAEVAISSFFSHLACLPADERRNQLRNGPTYSLIHASSPGTGWLHETGHPAIPLPIGQSEQSQKAAQPPQTQLIRSLQVQATVHDLHRLAGYHQIISYRKGHRMKSHIIGQCWKPCRLAAAGRGRSGRGSRMLTTLQYADHKHCLNALLVP